MTEIQTPIDLGQTDQTHRRKVLTKLVASGNFDALDRMGIHVIEEEGVPYECCHQAAFPPSHYPKDIPSSVIRTWPTVDSPQPNDIVIYINQESGVVTHVGRVVDQGKVKSRWGLQGILCDHSPLDVPIYCGEEIEIVYYREPI